MSDNFFIYLHIVKPIQLNNGSTETKSNSKTGKTAH